MLIVLILNGFALGGCLLAFWKGAAPERIGAAFILGNIAFGAAITAILPQALAPTLNLVNDALIAFGFLGLTLRYGSLWLGAAMLLYAGQFALHSYYVVMDLPPDMFHARANNLIFVGVILCIVFGTVGAWRRRLRERRSGASLAAA